MAEPNLSEMLAAAAALLLQPPDARVLAALAESKGITLDLVQARQDFYDVLCVPQSGRYIPPYAHVLAQGHVKEGDWWHFPAPRFDGGDALAPWYETVGFDPQQMEIDPMLRGPHRPLDNVGLILAYLAGLVASRDMDDTDGSAGDTIIVTFMTEHVDSWFDRFCLLLGSSASPYLGAVTEAVQEAMQAIRASLSAPIGQSVADGSCRAISMGPPA